ncbi:hypothetical protein C922_05423 [Plasmodium inui San Antonio 1]|uniref:Uncharacterized protein n=1 Tax=Plasmodium inui San Antonio 1 TaxID=1237626 RepID=W7A518_9APIC|nr:hypothetical protein C922_05423 [Plasmodium inui San Antonio 1]EUD64199.1 hypothetical protein C922_05423 [Plasmodium inui San Antonio 1]
MQQPRRSGVAGPSINRRVREAENYLRRINREEQPETQERIDYLKAPPRRDLREIETGAGMIRTVGFRLKQQCHGDRGRVYPKK